MSDIYEDLKARASEHGAVPAFKFTKDDPPGMTRTAFVRLMADENSPGFARLVIDDTPEPATTQYLVEVERLRALVGQLII